MKYVLLLANVLLVLCCSQNSFAQTFSQTFTQSGTRNIITFTVKLVNVDITYNGDPYNNYIRFNTNMLVTITTNGFSNSLNLRNVEIVTKNSTNNVATEGTEYGPTLNPLSSPYSGIVSTNTSSVLSGYTLSSLSDQNTKNNTAVLSVANYKTINLKFTVQDNSTGQVYNFDGYNTSNGEDIPLAIVTPVSLSSFSATSQSNTVVINWSTASEINNAGFYVLHGTDINNLQSLGYVASKANNGNSQIALNYDKTDYNPITNYINYYQLKQVDLDGKATLSKVINVDFRQQLTSSLSLYPNPVRGNNVTIANTTIGSTIQVLSIDGRIFLSQKVNSLPASLILPNMSAGIYLVRSIDANGKSESLKFIKQ